jgi:hypothetical protein
MLAEARGYHLSLVLAHQHLAQLSRDLRDAVSANARNKLWFAVSPEDARVLERHVTPELSAHDLAHLDAYQAAARLVAGGAEQPACTLRSRPAPQPTPGRADAIRAASRHRYGRTPQQRRGRDLGQTAQGDAPPLRQQAADDPRPSRRPDRRPSPRHT